MTRNDLEALITDGKNVVYYQQKAKHAKTKLSRMRAECSERAVRRSADARIDRLLVQS